MKLLIITLLSLCVGKLFAQQVGYPNKKDSSVTEMKEYYNKCGKVLTITNGYPLQPTSKSSFMPTSEQLLLAEQLMAEKYSNTIKTDQRAKALMGTEYKTHYIDYYRQYVGIINESGDKTIFIQLLKCCKKKVKKCFPNWQKEVVSPLDEDPCTITNTFLVNLTQRTISLY